jgi:citrate synthase
MSSGLDGIVVADTVLSEVDGQNGRLVVRGSAIEDLAGTIGFAALAARLWDGLTDRPETPAAVAQALGDAREDAFNALGSLLPPAVALPPLEGLRMLLAGLPADAPLPARYRLAGAIPVFLAALQRTRAGRASIAPDPAADHAADYLRMATGAVPSPATARALDAYLVTVAEHGMNASTFTARVVASTRAGDVAAVVAALGALQGPLHGGAPGPVLDMLDAIAAAPDVDGWLAERLAAGERLMGFGHRIYRVRDPRADVLAAQLAKLGEAGPAGPSQDAGAIPDPGDRSARLAFARKVEARALAALAAHKPERPLDTNVEFYTALLLDAVGIPRDAFTAVFAMGRVAGWTAHAAEQVGTGRIIRPQSRYVGPVPVLA